MYASGKVSAKCNSAYKLYFNHNVFLGKLTHDLGVSSTMSSQNTVILLLLQGSRYIFTNNTNIKGKKCNVMYVLIAYKYALIAIKAFQTLYQYYIYAFSRWSIFKLL